MVAVRIGRCGDCGEVQGYRYPIEVIGHALWLYHRFALSLRDVEEPRSPRCGRHLRDDPVLVCEVRARRRCPVTSAATRPADKWHFDQVFVKINGTTHYLWRAVDQHGNVVDILAAVAPQRGGGQAVFPQACPGLAAARRGRLSPTSWPAIQVARPRELLPSVTRSPLKYLNNRAENSHQPTRVRERVMNDLPRLGRPNGPFASAASDSTFFGPVRHLISAPELGEPR